ncbi:MAG: DUF4837 family protein [candidate division WOR-3 bacterium]|nr:MAG: DUF4837 family protein [candidate division WOR-3 bacterium]
MAHIILHIKEMFTVNHRWQEKMALSAGALAVILLSITCARTPPSVGKSRDIVVIASSVDTALVSHNIQIYNYVPQRERLFYFLFAADTAIHAYDKFHTIFLYGSLEDEFMNLLLSQDAKQATISDTFNLFKLHDVWARNQLCVVLAASERGYIAQGIEKFSPLIREILEENFYQRIKENYYSKGIDQKTKTALSTMGFTFDVGEAWLIDSTHKEDNFIYLHAHFPDRSIFFYTEDQKEAITASYAHAKRDTITSKYYNGDYILKELTHAEPIEFKDMSGIRLRGVWQNDSLVAGGPFISYFLKRGDTLRVIDALLFYPGERKSDFLMTLEVILNSFEISEIELQ